MVGGGGRRESSPRGTCEEILAQGTGCGLDSNLVWTADSCGDSSDGGQECGDFESRMAALAAECCDEPTEDCSTGTPASCNAGCAELMLPFRDACLEELTQNNGRKAADQMRAAASRVRCPSRATKSTSWS